VELETALVQIIEAMGPPQGPTRALAISFREEWQAAAASPEWVAHLLETATEASAEGPRRDRRLPS
jgi:hypothetical protein